MGQSQPASTPILSLLTLTPGLVAIALWLARAPAAGIALGTVISAALITLVLWVTWSRARPSFNVHAESLSRDLGERPARIQPGSTAGPDASGRVIPRVVGGVPAANGQDAPLVRAAVDAVQDIVIVFDTAGAIRFFNRAAEEFFGGGTRPIRERAIEDLFVQSEILEIHRGAARGEIHREEIQITGRQGRRTFQTLAAPIEAPSSGLVLLLLRDTTDIQSALRLGGDFVASVSHEMRTPLASVKGALETLRDSASDDPSMTERLHQMIATNVDRLEALTADVLRLSQLESAGASPEITIFETKPVFDSIASLLDPLLSERGLRIEVDVAPDLHTIQSDARLFELVLKNLLENAGKFAFENSALRLVGRADGQTTIWQVIDRGIGIPLNQQSRIFDRFYQVDTARTGSPKRRGTGLGLAIVQNAVKALGGSIRVDSVWQQGTTMTVELPDSFAQSPRSTPAET